MIKILSFALLFQTFEPYFIPTFLMEGTWKPVEVAWRGTSNEYALGVSVKKWEKIYLLVEKLLIWTYGEYTFDTSYEYLEYVFMQKGKKFMLFGQKKKKR